MMDKIRVELGFETVPKEYTGEGENVSPPFKIEGGKGTSMAIIVEDPDAPRGLWVHWVIWNLPVVSVIPRAIPKRSIVTVPIQCNQGMNTGKDIGFDGPFPPAGMGPHRYFFKVYVLNQKMELPASTTKKDLEKAMEGKILQYGEAMARYERR
jgi:Raf kinase inhibitor-like YbhB/YbcL family protein